MEIHLFVCLNICDVDGPFAIPNAFFSDSDRFNFIVGCCVFFVSFDFTLNVNKRKPSHECLRKSQSKKQNNNNWNKSIKWHKTRISMKIILLNIYVSYVNIIDNTH